MEESIKVIVKEVGNAPEYRTIPNTSEAFQELVGGNIEPVNLGPDVLMIVNEEGIPLGLPYNCEIGSHHVYGTFVLCGVDGEEFASMPEWVTLAERR